MCERELVNKIDLYVAAFSANLNFKCVFISFFFWLILFYSSFFLAYSLNFTHTRYSSVRVERPIPIVNYPYLHSLLLSMFCTIFCVVWWSEFLFIFFACMRQHLIYTKALSLVDQFFFLNFINAIFWACLRNIFSYSHHFILTGWALKSRAVILHKTTHIIEKIDKGKKFTSPCKFAYLFLSHSLKFVNREYSMCEDCDE